jgi:hypothetical protein
MIKVNEIRVGSLIRLNGKSKSQIRVYKIHFELREGHLINGDIPESYLEGIPLTEEWALKLGGKKIPHFTVTNAIVFDIGRGREICIGCVGTPNLMIFLSYTENGKVTDLVCVHNWDYDGDINVHQLQNLIHSLTGEELIVKL